MRDRNRGYGRERAAKDGGEKWMNLEEMAGVMYVAPALLNLVRICHECFFCFSSPVAAANNTYEHEPGFG